MDNFGLLLILSIFCFCVTDCRPESSSSSAAAAAAGAHLERQSRSIDQMVFPDSREENAPSGATLITSMQMRRPLSPTPAPSADCRQITVVRHANGTLGHRYVDCQSNASTTATTQRQQPSVGSRFDPSDNVGANGGQQGTITTRTQTPSSEGRDHIVFPTESAETSGEPECANGQRFCTRDDSYPQSKIDQLLQRLGNLEDLLQMDVPDEMDLATRVDVPGEETFCDYESRIEYPKKALSRDEKWLTVVNHSNYTQGILMETCRNIDRPCKMSEIFPYTIKTKCIQKYQYRHLLALHEDGQLRREYFSMPTCCLCTFSKM